MSDLPPAAGAPAQKPERHTPSHVFNVAILIIGGAGLAWMVHRLGMSNVRAVLTSVRGWFPLIMGLDVIATVFDSLAIRAFMKPEARMIPYVRVLAAQASGRAVNVFVPGGAGGETTKITMLVDRAPRARVVSSILLYNMGNLYLSIFILLVGAAITTMLVDLPHQLQVAVSIGIGVLVAAAVGLALIVRRGTVATILDTARVFRLLSHERRAKWKARLIEFDRHLRDLDPRKATGARLGLVYLLASRATSWTITTVMLHAVGVSLSFTLLCGIFSVGVLITWISSIVPLGVGVADGSNYALYGILGAPSSAGLTVTLLSRVRNLSMGVLGLLVMAVVHTVNRVQLARRNARLAALAAAARDRGTLAPEMAPD